jgi:hypothetical protein
MKLQWTRVPSQPFKRFCKDEILQGSRVGPTQKILQVTYTRIASSEEDRAGKHEVRFVRGSKYSHPTLGNIL